MTDLTIMAVSMAIILIIGIIEYIQSRRKRKKQQYASDAFQGDLWRAHAALHLTKKLEPKERESSEPHRC